MGRKAFATGNKVVGKTKAYRGKQGTVLVSGVGSGGKRIRVKWSNGVIDEVTSHAIDVIPTLVAMNPVFDSSDTDENDDEGDDEHAAVDDSCSSSEASNYFSLL